MRGQIEEGIACCNLPRAFDVAVRHAVEFGDFRSIEDILDKKIAFAVIEPYLFGRQHKHPPAIGRGTWGNERCLQSPAAVNTNENGPAGAGPS